MSQFEEVLAFLIAAVVIVPVFRRLKSSPVLGYLAAGVALGPFGLAVVREPDEVHLLGELGVVFLLFTIGLELSLERLKVMRRLVFGLGAAQVLAVGTLLAIIGWGLGLAPAGAVVVGSALALSSTAFVLQMMVEKGELTSRHGRVSFAILLFQDLAIVPLLALVPLLGEQDASVALALGLALAKAVAATGAMMLGGRFLLRPALRLVAAARSPELFTAFVLLIVLGTGWAMVQVGLSMALGAFLAGLLLSETEYRHQIEADIRPFRGILLGLFFMSVGLMLDLRLVWQSLGPVLALVAGLLLIKAVAITALCRLARQSWSVAVRTGCYLSQGGEFGFVLIGGALTAGLLADAIGQTLLAVIALGMVATPLMVHLAQLVDRLLQARQPEPGLEPLEDAGTELVDHVLIAGFGRVGQTVAKSCARAGQSFLALDMDQLRVRRCHTLGMPVYYGDASHLEVLTAAGAERAAAAVITLDHPLEAARAVTALRAHYPKLRIFARARDLHHAARLERAGATAVVPETIEASLKLGSLVLQHLNPKDDAAIRAIEALRADNYALLGEVITAGGRDDD